MQAKNQNIFSDFLRNNKSYPVLSGLAAGLYPVLFYYSRNFNMVNSWEHVGYFISVYLLFPILLFVIAHRLARLPVFAKYEKYVLPFLNIFSFLFILKAFLFVVLERKIIVGIFIVALLFAVFLHKYLKKVIVIQLILALMGTFTVGQEIYKNVAYSEAWKLQPDNIEDVVFKKKPNVYFIEPDGYVSFSELKKGFYKAKNSLFEDFLLENNFKSYPNFRSNYNTTLTSNSAAFTMKHHYFNYAIRTGEVQNGRQNIISSNAVLNTFKKNDYETYFLSESPYFLLNRPKMAYDHSNIEYSEIAYIHNGLGEIRPLMPPLESYLNDGVLKPKFFFIQILRPTHIEPSENYSEGAAVEREKYLERLEESNTLMTQMIESIQEKDPEALIIIMADHGGFVGLDFSFQTEIKTQDRDLIYSIFSSNLTIHWPNGEVPNYDSKLKTPVNVFRILFAYLSNNESYLGHLQPNESFIVLKEGAQPGIYKYIDASGNIVFEKMEPEE